MLHRGCWGYVVFIYPQSSEYQWPHSTTYVPLLDMMLLYDMTRSSELRAAHISRPSACVHQTQRADIPSTDAAQPYSHDHCANFTLPPSFCLDHSPHTPRIDASPVTELVCSQVSLCRDIGMESTHLIPHPRDVDSCWTLPSVFSPSVLSRSIEHRYRRHICCCLWHALACPFSAVAPPSRQQ